MASRINQMPFFVILMGRGAVAMLVGGAPLSGGPGAGCDDGGLAGKYWIVLGALAWI